MELNKTWKCNILKYFGVVSKWKVYLNFSELTKSIITYEV